MDIVLSSNIYDSLSHNELSVLLWIIRRADEKGKVSFARGEIVAQTGLPLSDVRRILEKFKVNHYLSRYMSRKKGGITCSISAFYKENCKSIEPIFSRYLSRKDFLPPQKCAPEVSVEPILEFKDDDDRKTLDKNEETEKKSNIKEKNNKKELISKKENNENIIFSQTKKETEDEILISISEEEEQEVTKLTDDEIEKLTFGVSLPEHLRTCILLWLVYKKRRRQSYTCKDGVARMISHLCKLCNDDPEIARQIINQSKGNNYNGLFALKTQHTYERSSNDYTTRQERERTARLASYAADLAAGSNRRKGKKVIF